MLIKVDRDKCIGGGNCVITAPAIFSQDDDGFVVLLDQAPADDAIPAVRQAVEMCPARVISIA